MLNPNTASEIATPGQIAIHGARNMYVRPEPDSIPPHAGYGGGTPNPRNESADSARMAGPRPIVARMMIVAGRLCGLWRTPIRPGPQPPPTPRADEVAPARTTGPPPIPPP